MNGTTLPFADQHRYVPANTQQTDPYSAPTSPSPGDIQLSRIPSKFARQSVAQSSSPSPLQQYRSAPNTPPPTSTSPSAPHPHLSFAPASGPSTMPWVSSSQPGPAQPPSRDESGKLPFYGDFGSLPGNQRPRLSASHPRAAPQSPSALYANKSVVETLAEQNVDPGSGLSLAEANSRLLIHGPNELVVKEEESLTTKFLEQFKNPLILLLFGSAMISIVLNHIEDAVSITLAIVIVVTVAFIQEYRSEQSLEALNKLVPHYAHVVRNGHEYTIDANDLVPGDIIRFRTGDRIPADIRLISACDVAIDQSTLTGETEPCKKHTDVIDNGGSVIPLQDRNNIAFMGTLTRQGYGSGVVIGTGEHSEFGVVFHMMKDVEVRKTPLQHKMDHLGKQLSIMSFGLIFLIAVIGVIQGRTWLEMFTIGVSLAVAAIPEGLPIVVTVTLALGVLRMAKRSSIIKKLPSVEALGSVNAICVDKTGTLTLNKMTVTRFFTAAQARVYEVDESAPNYSPAVHALVRIGNLCNNAKLNEDQHWIGQPTETSILEYCSKISLGDLRLENPRINEIPFNTDKKYMAVECEYGIHGEHENTFYVKGAAETVLAQCFRYYHGHGDIRPIDTETRSMIESKASQSASQGLRVLCMAYGRAMSDLVFVGFVAMEDPPRPGVPETIHRLLTSGIKIVMITGDSADTACAIATNLGIPFRARQGTLSGTEVESLSERQLQEVVEGASIIYRATPKHKMHIVRALQSQGYVVAMTGDGVNDAPALRLADIGVSMGKSGTDVSKEAADMILVDDDFSTVLYAIEEGKSIFYNIQNFLKFQLSTSMAALSLVAFSTILGFANPLNAMQILWINIICDGPVAQSLGVEAVDPNIMRKPPRPKDEPIITRELVTRIVVSAVIMVAGTLYVFRSEMMEGDAGPRVTTMTFTCFVFFDMFNALACRSDKRSVFEIGIGSNQMFNLAVVACLLGQLLVIYVPFLQVVFQTEALSLGDLVFLTLLGSIVLWVDEFRKLVGYGGRGFSGVLGVVERSTRGMMQVKQKADSMETERLEQVV
ncbi:PMR1-type calcium-transporting P-type ATPase [Polychytrium aggregatum]|uniref:PMR1-type calcium-transporting P-type ATPase n=1 Tax=Polychytrium aggregatum TaxID=110093 RepID=UPI0022FE456E|nr:PMR1-type calcium-transporting P-type ATPase [Polychytrium aggregatum]KAI9199744.1 PMR1-type calcium-transporting P-type ATPase [Polychytrium aggregatum]